MHSSYVVSFTGCGLGPKNIFCTQIAVFIQKPLKCHSSLDITQSNLLTDSNNLELLFETNFPFDERTTEEKEVIIINNIIYEIWSEIINRSKNWEFQEHFETKNFIFYFCEDIIEKKNIDLFVKNIVDKMKNLSITRQENCIVSNEEKPKENITNKVIFKVIGYNQDISLNLNYNNSTDFEFLDVKKTISCKNNCEKRTLYIFEVNSIADIFWELKINLIAIFILPFNVAMISLKNFTDLTEHSLERIRYVI